MKKNKLTNKEIAQSLEEQQRIVRAIYVSSYIPRKCGIATFTKDLTNAMNALNPYALAEIMAVIDPGSSYEFPWEVKFRINQEDINDYINAAEYINNSSAEVVCLQHDFGLYGGPDGEYIVEFLKKINKRIVSTLHTILEKPNPNQKKIIQEICNYSDAVVVMIEPAVKRLLNVYGVDSKKVAVIHHGVPDIPFGGTDFFKKQTHLTGKTVMTAINLISENKGYEYAISAIPEIIKKVPNFLFLIIGETHPVVKMHEGEVYRNKLKSLVKELKVENHVRFINRYITLDQLLDYLRATDIYITPYLDPQQIASGTLSYAVGAGKICISTPYLYAQEVINGDRGVLVPFRNSGEIAKAVIRIIQNPKLKSSLEREAYRYGRVMTWSSVALAYLDLFSLILKNQG
jgi:glycosyltransferase involved in cell wall biosynthesis